MEVEATSSTPSVNAGAQLEHPTQAAGGADPVPAQAQAPGFTVEGDRRNASGQKLNRAQNQNVPPSKMKRKARRSIEPQRKKREAGAPRGISKNAAAAVEDETEAQGPQMYIRPSYPARLVTGRVASKGEIVNDGLLKFLLPSSRSRQGNLFACSNCSADISSRPRIVNAECTPPVVLCLACFASGAEPGCHKSDQAYRVVDNLDFAPFPEYTQWSAADELLLLDAISAYGVGDWESVAAHLGTKSAQVCADHYLKVYVCGADGVRPPKGPTQAERRQAAKVDAHLVAKARHAHATPGLAAFNGFMPLREDFDDVYDPEAEELMLGLHLDPGAPDFKDKLNVVQRYNSRLKTRDAMHKYFIEHVASNSDAGEVEAGISADVVAMPRKVMTRMKRLFFNP